MIVDVPHAVHVRTGERLAVLNYGTVVRVVRLKEANMVVNPDGNMLVWQFEEPVAFALQFSDGVQVSGSIHGIGDEALRPIHPDGITEEEVRELFAPASKEVSPC